MWILLIKRPKTYQAFKKMCRAYGLTMADIRFQEAWAMAVWLQRDGLYEISPDSELPSKADITGLQEKLQLPVEVKSAEGKSASEACGDADKPSP